nr:phenylalanine--tRNA ligase subunit beta [Bacteroidota bacterium]
MKISYNWLKEYIHIDLDPEQVAEILTNTGLEVEGLEKIETVKGGLQGVLTGEVMSCEKHPDADRLSVTTVDIGTGELLPIVCGAPNVEKGQKVVVATVGTTLYTGETSFEIKRSKIRGQVSMGMICAEDELGLGESHEGIMVLPDDTEIGIQARDYFRIEEDYVFEIGLTPNRSDAMSHIGVARDLQAVLNIQNPNNPISLIKPCVDGFRPDNNDLQVEVVVEDQEACPRYSSLVITDVQVKESPDWLKNRLIAIGLRPINNMVDISNFIMHETGHPTHFFDLEKIKGHKVVIRKEPAGTKFTTLDEEVRELSGMDLMICNESDGMCIAGVFGGLDSGVTEKTKNVFLESAYFDPKTTRRTARFHRLNTDSSFRFERGADPNATLYALKRAAMLIKELAGGTIASEINDVYPNPINSWEVKVTFKNIDRLIGKKLDHDQIKDILIWVGMEIIAEDDDGLTVEVPTYKNDVTREADVIEEILRIYGYNNVEFPDQLRSSLSYIEKPDREKVQNQVADFLTNNGFAEIMSNSLTKADYAKTLGFLNPDHDVKIYNPLSTDLNVMRQGLLTSGLEAVLYNQNRKNLNLKLYEFGSVYSQDKSKADATDVLARFNESVHLSLFLTGNQNNESWHRPTQVVDFWGIKFFILKIFERLNIDPQNLTESQVSNQVFEMGLMYEQNNKPVVSFGKLAKNLLKAFEIKQDIYYADICWDTVLELLKRHKISYVPVSKYPEVRRDLALLVDKDVMYSDLERLALKIEKKLLKKVNLFDVYEGDKIEAGKKSYALSFILQDETKTLTDKIIDKTMQRIITAYERNMNAIIR